MHHALLALDSTERFTVLIGFITAIIGVLTAIGAVVYKGAKGAWSLAEATRANTDAVNALTTRVDRIEQIAFQPSARPPEDGARARYPIGQQAVLQEAQ